MLPLSIFKRKDVMQGSESSCIIYFIGMVKHTYIHIYTHTNTNTNHTYTDLLSFFFFLLENKQPNVTNLVINFIYHISTHSCTPIFYLSVHAMRRRRFNRMSTRAKQFVLFFISFCRATLFALAKENYWHEMC